MNKLTFVGKELKQVDDFCECSDCVFNRGDQNCTATQNIKKMKLSLAVGGCGTVRE